MSKIDLQALSKIIMATEAETAKIQNNLQAQSPVFVANEDYIALLAFGGTIQSAYVPAAENIEPVWLNPAFERINELLRDFGVVNKGITGAILLAKDSRDITNTDMVQLVHTIQCVPNRRILISCGTYMLPIIAKAMDFHFGQEKSDKTIGITGSWLPASQEGHDVDFNIGGCIAAINALFATRQKGIVFAHFHGEIFIGKDIEKLNLHPPGINPKFVRPTVVTE